MTAVLKRRFSLLLNTYLSRTREIVLIGKEKLVKVKRMVKKEITRYNQEFEHAFRALKIKELARLEEIIEKPSFREVAMLELTLPRKPTN